MSPHYNVLPEAICCCLLVNHVVYKHVSMTTRYVARNLHTHKTSCMYMASLLI